MTVLLVDDEAPALRELVRNVDAALPGAGLHSFTKAREALEFAENTKIDLAFLDINLPFMNGITLAKKLGSRWPSCNIIFCTGYSDYALDAWGTYSSAYLLKPISVEKVREAMQHLRYPPAEEKPRIRLHCFGNFDVLCDGKPVTFRYKKTRELLAYLTDCNGAEATTQEIISAIFEENKTSYFGNIRLDLLDTFAALGASEAIYAAYGRMRIVREKVQCDYFDYLDGKNADFKGKYMSQYSFAEATCAALLDVT